CVATTSVTITQPELLVATVTSQDDPNCYGGNDGSAQLGVVGGTSPYTYAWSNGAVTQNLTGLVAGTYSVTVTDAQGCVATTSVTITQPELLVATVTSKDDPNCYGGSDGSAQLGVVGGTAPYTYLWSNGTTTQNLTGLVAGTYSVTVTDA